jgi:hypothetical protein
MTPTQELILKLRFLVNDKDKKTFTDEELEMILKEADCINCAASNAWMFKGMQYENTIGEISEYKTGDETYKASNIKDLVSIAYQNSERFKGKCEKVNNVSIMLGISTEISL